MSIKIKSNYQDLLKCFAILTMIIDHLGLYIFIENNNLRLIGRLAMPIFGFFAGYNFNGKPKLKILVFGLLLYAATTLLFKNFTPLNILVSIFLGQCYLYLYRYELSNIKNNYLKIVFLLILGFLTIYLFDYGSIVIAIMVLGFIAARSTKDLRLSVALSLVLSMLSSILVFDFSTMQLIILILLIFIEYCIMITINYNQSINFNINIISRNSIYIYCLHVIILQYIFVCYLL